MEQWWDKYLDDIPIKEFEPLFKEFDINEKYKKEWIFKKAALCRLSFAFLLGTDEQQSFGLPAEAIISKTLSGIPKGRPKTSKWAFWLGLIIRNNLKIREKPASYDFLSKLICIFLERNSITQAEIGDVFVDLRREAESHATSAAQILLEKVLKKNLNDKKFERDTKEFFGKDLPSDAQASPVIVNGKINEQWIKSVLSTRKAILRRVNKNGALEGRSPQIDIAFQTRVFKNIPITPPPFEINTKNDGVLHFNRDMNIPVPPTIMEQERSKGAEISLNVSGNKDGGTTTIRFPEYFLGVKEPFVAALYAMPVWWFEWQKVFH